MPRFQKWLSSAYPEAPADEVARAALAERLLAVSHFLDKSVGDSDEAEAIHQLRVWTRRASAALKLFEPAIPKSHHKWMKKTLRKVRRKAGAVRDCDVHLQHLEAGGLDSRKRIAKVLRAERHQARQTLKTLRRRLQKGDRFELHAQHLLAGIGWPKRHSSKDAPPFASFCREQLRPLVSDFLELAEADLHEDAKLHALRIAGKRLRYALELAPAIMPARTHHQLYSRLDQIQDRLGDVVDQLAAIDHICAWLNDTAKKSDRRRLRELLGRQEQQLAKLRTKLLRWWSPKRRENLRRLCQIALTAAESP
jgi:CHAD domain-containing protein